MTRLLLLLVLLAGFTAVVNGYSSGQVSAACSTMTPGHGGTPQSSAPRVVLEVDQGEINEKTITNLTLKAFSPSDQFKGFMVQAKDANGNLIGEFTDLSSDVQKLTCQSNTGATVSHANPTAKEMVSLIYLAPSVDEDTRVKFQFTVVKDKLTYWVKQDAESELTIKNVPGDDPDPEGDANSDAEPDTKAKAESSAEGSAEANAEGNDDEEAHKDYDGCSTTKGCFGLSEDCVSAKNCDAMVTYSITNDKVDMTLHGKAGSEQYTAVGFSHDSSMGDDLVIACMGGQSVGIFWNPGKTTPVGVTGLEISPNSVSSDNGYISCSFTMDTKVKVAPNEKETEYDFGSGAKYHLLVAQGAVSNDKLQKHSFTGKTPSANKVDLSDTGAVEGESDTLLRLHGAFMIFGWLFCASVGMLFARFMKETWRGKELLSAAIWFRVHQLCMSLCLICTLIGFVVVAAERGFLAYDTDFIRSNPHPVTGALTCILGALQPCMALLRPKPDAKYRWIFNWAHWFVGNAALILAFVTVFLAYDLGAAAFIAKTDYIVLLYVFLGLFLSVQITLICQRHFALRKAANSVMDNESSMRPKDEQPPLCGQTFRVVVLGIYTLLVAMIIFIIIIFFAITKTGGKAPNWF